MVNSKQPEISDRLFFFDFCYGMSCRQPETSLKNNFKDYFLVGTAIDTDQVFGTDTLSPAFKKTIQLYYFGECYEVGGNSSVSECL